MKRETTPAATRLGLAVIPKNRSASKGASPKEQEQRRIAKKLRKLKKR